MAITNPRDIPITRDMVWEWLQEYEGRLEPTIKLRTFLMAKVEAMELDDAMLDTSHRDDFVGDETHVVDTILEDIGSYSAARD